MAQQTTNETASRLRELSEKTTAGRVPLFPGLLVDCPCPPTKHKLCSSVTCGNDCHGTGKALADVHLEDLLVIARDTRLLHEVKISMGSGKITGWRDGEHCATGYYGGDWVISLADMLLQAVSAREGVE